MTFIQKNTLPKLTLFTAGSFALLAMTGCSANNPAPEVLPDTPSSSASATASTHLDVSKSFQPASDWTLIRESDRTKPDGTKIHNIRWDTGDDLLTVTDIKALFDENGYTVNECFEQIGNCNGTAPIEGSTVNISITATAFTNSETKKLDHNDLSFETSMK